LTKPGETVSVTTLNHDEELPRETSYVVVGFRGWTDTIPRDTIDMLVSIGAIKWASETSGPGWTTVFYRSVAAPEK
jgi:hypothetical protein